MSEGKRYLDKVTGQLKERIGEVRESILQGQKDIEGMHEYYWENYTEMDQYGYEDFDNQQALLHQVNANQEQQAYLHRLEKMLDSPFFGRVDFRYEGEEESEKFYIGIGNFSQKAGHMPLIYDWRAPVSGLFYDFDKGPASYEAPLGLMEGEITSKWQYKIRGGRMIYEFQSDMKIDDEILKAELGGNGDVQLKNIVRTIQKEQNAIIRNTKDRIMVIQGAAGSGKTSIALHRIAYLLYHDRKNLKSSDILILSPNSVFSDYISHILPELGEENIQEMSFDLFAYRELRDTIRDCHDRYDEIELELQGITQEQKERLEEKQSETFVSQVEGFLAFLEDELMAFKDVEFRGLKLTENELIHLFYFKFQDIPLLSRMDAVMEYFIDEYETLHDCTLSEEDLDTIVKKFQKLYVTRDLYKIYNKFLEENGYPMLPDVPQEKRVLAYEDVYPLLYLKYRLCRVRDHKNIKHLVIDEMQDYSYLQYLILRLMFNCRMTILGDRAQTMEERNHDVLEFLPGIFGKDMRKIILNKSYRNTVEIAEYANRTAGIRDMEIFQRHGKEVEEKKLDGKEEAVEEIFKNLALGSKGYETAALLTMSEEEALEVYKNLREKEIPAFYVDRNSSSFKKGLTVTTFYLAKGLEFDQVFVLARKKKTPLLIQAEYICATRALHELYVYECL